MPVVTSPAALITPGQPTASPGARDELSRAAAIAEIFDVADRRSVPIRTSFVQTRDYYYRRPAPGALSTLVRRGRKSTFDQYLLALAAVAQGEPSLSIESRVWTRALGLASTDSSRRIVSRNWRILSELDLVRVRRDRGHLHVTLLRENGSGEPYKQPNESKERILRLDCLYWRKGYHERLTVPGMTVLLIALTLGDWFALPTRRGPGWYGLSRSTLERGFKNAYDAAVLGRRYSLKEAPLAPMGYTKENHYILLAPFGPRGIVAKSAPPSFRSNWPAPKRVPGKRRRGRRRRRASETATPATAGTREGISFG